MVYFIIFIVLVLISLFECIAKKEISKRFFFSLSSFIILIFCSFRYQMGFDYVSYSYIYNSLPDTLFSNVVLNDVHGEYLFLKFFIFFKSLGINYAYAAAIYQIISILLFLRFIHIYSPYKSFSVLILFSWYFAYIFGLIRQGFAMSLIWGIAYPFFEQKKRIKYYVTVFIATLFHTASCIAFLIPSCVKILRIKKIEKKLQIVILLIIFAIAFVPNPLLYQVAEITGKGKLYVESLEISYLALFNRALSFLIIFFLCKIKDERYIVIKYVYLMGFLLYLLTAQSELIASRLAAVFKFGDIVLIPYILTSLHKKYVPIFLVVMFAYLGFMFMNLLSYMASQIDIHNVWNYQYKMVFFK